MLDHELRRFARVQRPGPAPARRRGSHPPEMPGPERCDWPWHSPYVRYRGCSIPCYMIPTPDRGNFGKVGRDGSITGI